MDKNSLEMVSVVIQSNYDLVFGQTTSGPAKVGRQEKLAKYILHFLAKFISF